jgi:hypothetical protein
MVRVKVPGAGSTGGRVRVRVRVRVRRRVGDVAWSLGWGLGFRGLGQQIVKDKQPTTQSVKAKIRVRVKNSRG